MSAPLAAPPGVEAIDQDSFYGRLADHGFCYGGPFRSLRGIGHDPTRPELVYAEVGLPADTDVSGYGIHPALLDAALHPLAGAFFGAAAEADPVALRLPFAFSGVSLHATAATRLHVQLTCTGVDTFRLHATDPAGAPVITIDALSLRAAPEPLGGPPPVRAQDSVLELAWSPLPDHPCPAAGSTPAWAVLTEDPDHLPASLQDGPIHTDLSALAPRPELVIWALPLPGAVDEDADPLQRVHALTRHTLSQLQGWLARPDTAGTQLVILTRHAVTVSAADRAPDLAHAAAWALIHTAQNEHPHRIILLDTDTTAATDQHIVATLARRAGRRTPAGPAPRHPTHPPADPDPDPDPTSNPRLETGHHRQG